MPSSRLSFRVGDVSVNSSGNRGRAVFRQDERNRARSTSVNVADRYRNEKGHLFYVTVDFNRIWCEFYLYRSSQRWIGSDADGKPMEFDPVHKRKWYITSKERDRIEAEEVEYTMNQKHLVRQQERASTTTTTVSAHSICSVRNSTSRPDRTGRSAVPARQSHGVTGGRSQARQNVASTLPSPSLQRDQRPPSGSAYPASRHMHNSNDRDLLMSSRRNICYYASAPQSHLSSHLPSTGGHSYPGMSRSDHADSCALPRRGAYGPRAVRDNGPSRHDDSSDDAYGARGHLSTNAQASQNAVPVGTTSHEELTVNYCKRDDVTKKGTNDLGNDWEAYPDGGYKYDNGNGSKYEKDKDGNAWYEGPGGKGWVEDADGNREHYDNEGDHGDEYDYEQDEYGCDDYGCDDYDYDEYGGFDDFGGDGFD
ncbi:unnamed protein product [Amoebophrya sp. A25]|nr:unnamed protein product [Amoebophrya sp. A25]|eukprot:GSA25T00025870001.1